MDNNRLIIREATEEDIELLKNHNLKSFGSMKGSNTTEHLYNRNVLNRMLLIAYYDTELIGFAIVTKGSSSNKKNISVHNIGVELSVQGKEAYRALMEEINRWAKQTGAELILFS